MWMVVSEYFSTQAAVDNIVNIDAIVRVGRNTNGCYIKFLDGTSIDVQDTFQEIKAVLLKAEGK